ncbi:site-specific integrase [Desulfoscipio gibsoniae]|uniref:site-specific integrase n=1 Tax=Desulfoscipio gibsoniae TaxID=102134 RepID=UPI000232AB7A|nr:site-specific integrase [Desulfoscipio gibsoniae]
MLGESKIPVIVNAVKDTHFEIPVFIALSTGARLGEIIGLQWSDIDLKKGVIHIKHTMERKKDGSLRLTNTKTVKSRRAVEIGEDTINKLKQHQTRQKEWEVAAEPGKWQKEIEIVLGKKQKNNLVCTHQDDGRPINPNALSSRFSRIAKKLELDIGFHDLRHTHATMLLKAGVHPKIVSERLGHANIGMTLDTYSHVLPTMQKEAAAIMENYLK